MEKQYIVVSETVLCYNQDSVLMTDIYRVEKFSDKVLDMVSKGYAPVGPAFFGNDSLFQTMVLTQRSGIVVPK